MWFPGYFFPTIKEFICCWSCGFTFCQDCYKSTSLNFWSSSFTNCLSVHRLWCLAFWASCCLDHFSWGGLAGLWVLLWVPHPWCITALEVLSAFSSCALMRIFLLPSQVQWGRRSNLGVSAVKEQGAGLHCSNNVIQEGLLIPNSSLLSHLRICFKPSPYAF